MDAHIIWIKQKTDAEEADIDHELSKGVARRLEKLLAGKGVPPVHIDAPGTSFVEIAKDGSGPKLNGILPQNQNLAEPDEEAIEMKLDARHLSNNYVKMA